MTTYKDIRGTHITTVTADPPAPVNGQMWYNSTTKVMKGFTENPVGAWATGGTLNTARNHLGSAGTKSLALVFGGATDPSTESNKTEQYNGSAFSEVSDLNTARRTNGTGATYTAAIAIGGYNSNPDITYNQTETWNGSSWTEVNDFCRSSKH